MKIIQKGFIKKPFEIPYKQNGWEVDGEYEYCEEI